MKSRSWLLALVLGVSLVASAACDSDDDTAGAGPTASDDGGAPGGAPGTTPPGATPPAVTTQVWVDKDFTLAEGDWFSEVYGGAPANGNVVVNVSWTAVDLLDNSPITISLGIEVNAGTGLVISDSPFAKTVSTSAGAATGVTIRNLNPGTRANGHVKVVWNAN